MPTVLLSAHTGYDEPYIRDLTDSTAPYFRHWQQLGLTFAAVMTGFLGTPAQGEAVGEFLQYHSNRGALCLVDPVMADHGRLYATCSPALVEVMRRLASKATVLTPNLTEACLLTDMSYDRAIKNPETVALIGRKLLSLGCRHAVITGVTGPDGIGNHIYSADMVEQVVSPVVPRCFAGTGDVFSSVLCGYLVDGMPLKKAVEKTADFVYRVTAYTERMGTPEQDGIIFEPFLSEIGTKY